MRALDGGRRALSPAPVLRPRCHGRRPAPAPLAAALEGDGGGGSSLLSRFGRVLREKAAADLDAMTALVSGTAKTRQQLGVVEELLAFWRARPNAAARRRPGCALSLWAHAPLALSRAA